MTTNDTLVTEGSNPTEAGQQPTTTASTEPAKANDAAATSTQQTEGEGKPAEPAAKAEGEAKDADGATKAEGDAKPGAPEKYEDFKLPEGFVPDTVLREEFAGLAKELNLSQEDAQKVADFGPKIVQRIGEKQIEALQTATTEWGQQTEADKELGGDKLPENLAVAKKAVEAFASPDLLAMLGKFDKETNPRGTGLGNHPEVVRMFYRVGKAISEDSIVTGGNGPALSRDPAEVLYGSKPQK